MTSRHLRLATLVTALLALAGCKDIVTGEDFTPEKGVYPGDKSNELTKEQNDALRNRMYIQRGGGL